MKLSASTIDSNLKAGRYSDGRNLYLTVNDNGAKSWVFMWKVGGKRREMGLGSYTGAGRAFSLSLKQARLAADATRMQLATGINPIEAKIAAKVASTTFETLMVEQIAILQKDWKGGKDGEQAAEWTRSLTTHAAKLLPMSVDKITTDIVVSVLKPIWATIPVTAERVRHRIEQVMGLAISKTPSLGANPARYRGHIEKLVGKRPTKKGQDNHAALDSAAIPAVMAKLLAATGMASKALAFLTLTATRTDEARLARVSEIDLDHVDGPRWTIPAARMKAGVEHIVPLSMQAVALLRSVIVEGAEFVFNGKDGQLGATALSDKLCKGSDKGGLGFKGKATVHGMRSTFSDWVGDCTSFAKEDREFCLAHGLDAVEGAYRRSTAVEKRRAIMQAWADFATGVEKVVQLKVAS